jgi:glucose/arabinose dehydrogenase
MHMSAIIRLKCEVHHRFEFTEGLRNRVGIIFWLVLLLIGQRCEAITLKRVATGLDRPVVATSPPNDNARLFIVEEHTGRIKILNLGTGVVNPTPFLEVMGLTTGNEQGLLGLAFHPNYDVNGFFYIYLTDSVGTCHIQRYHVSANPDMADAGSGLEILSLTHPQTNHNGGWLAFDPNDGLLYCSVGDGGGADDVDAGHTPGLGNGQDITVLLGKILRLDVNGDDFPADPNRNYAIPPSNPFVGLPGADEIWAYGLRNPWRNSFDRQTGDLYIADVGQNLREEVDFQPAAGTGGENYGWRVMEGTSCHNSTDPLPCNDPGFKVPIHEYNHVPAPNGGYCIIGGYVYRGPRVALQGVYFFGDNVTNQIWTFRYDGVNKTEFTNRTMEMTPDVGTVSAISSFGEDARGNLYIVVLGGAVFKIIPEPVVVGDFNGDGFVNLIDFEVLAEYWLDPNCGLCGGADFNADLTVSMMDLAAFAMRWLQ